MSTSFVCETPNIECTVIDDVLGVMYDLSPLEGRLGNWEVQGPDGSKYILNVCSPLVLTQNLVSTTCPTSAGACQATANGRFEWLLYFHSPFMFVSVVSLWAIRVESIWRIPDSR